MKPNYSKEIFKNNSEKTQNVSSSTTVRFNKIKGHISLSIINIKWQFSVTREDSNLLSSLLFISMTLHC